MERERRGQRWRGRPRRLRGLRIGPAGLGCAWYPRILCFAQLSQSTVLSSRGRRLRLKVKMGFAL